MSRFRRAGAKLLGVAVLLVGCTDAPSDATVGPSELLRLGKVPATSTCSTASPATELIDCLFPPPGLRNAAQQHLTNISRQYGRAQVESARGMMFDFVDFILSKNANGQLLDPQPLGRDAAVSLLLDRLFAAVGLDAPGVPAGALGEDGAVSVVSPIGGSVFTGTRLFGLTFAQNAVDRDVLVALVRLPDAASAGDGPLPTDLDQYGPFYEVRVSPPVPAINGVTTGLCYHPDGPLAPPADPDVRSRLRIARTVPGTEDEIKILEWVPQPSFIDCSDVTQLAMLRRREVRLLAALGESVGSFLARALGPAPLGAQSNGGATDTILVRGGPPYDVDAFQFATVLPGSGGGLPDLIVESLQTVPATPVGGIAFTVRAVVKNIGTASAGESQIRFSHPMPGYPGGQLTVGALAPGASETVDFLTGFPAGTVTDFEAYADHPDDVVESDEGNNVRLLTFTVVPPATLSGQVRVDGVGEGGGIVSVTGPYSGTVMSNMSGAYTFLALPLGAYAVSVSGYAPDVHFAVASKPVTLVSGGNLVNFDGARRHTAPVATPPGATSWVVQQPVSATSVCNGLGASPCASGASTVTVRAVASGPSGIFSNPWAGGVLFYYVHPTLGAIFIARVNGSSASATDNGLERSYTWTTTFDATGIPAGAGQLKAVGLTSGLQAYGTPMNSNVQVVQGTLEEDR